MIALLFFLCIIPGSQLWNVCISYHDKIRHAYLLRTAHVKNIYTYIKKMNDPEQKLQDNIN